MVYDPEVISYEQLLEVFWQLHDPASRPYLNQYRNAIFYLDIEQKRVAEFSRRALADHSGRPVHTAIEKAGFFTPAEDYHQKHYLKRQTTIMDILRKRFPDPQQLFRSTDAARLNGFVGCNGEPSTLGRQLRKLDLPTQFELDLFENLTLTCRDFHDSSCALPPLKD